MRALATAYLITFLVMVLAIAGCAALLVKIDAMGDELRQARAAADAAQRNAGAAQTEIEALRSENAALLAENEALKAQLSQQAPLIDGLRAELNKAYADVKYLADQLAAAGRVAAAQPVCPAPAGLTDMDRALIALSAGAFVLGLGLLLTVRRR